MSVVDPDYDNLVQDDNYELESAAENEHLSMTNLQPRASEDDEDYAHSSHDESSNESNKSSDAIHPIDEQPKISPQQSLKKREIMLKVVIDETEHKDTDGRDTFYIDPSVSYKFHLNYD